MTTYSTSLKLELPGDGQQTGTWGQTTNRNLGTLLEQAITGVKSIVMSNANYTLTNLNGASDEARNAVLVVTGTNTAVRDIIAPLVNKLYTIANNTTGGFGIRIIGSSGTGVTIFNGMTTLVYCDGTNFYSGVNGIAGNFVVDGNAGVTGNSTVSGTLTVASDALFTGTGEILLPNGTTAQRSALPSFGMFRFNSQTNIFEGFSSAPGTAISSISFVTTTATLTTSATHVLSTGDVVKISGATPTAYNGTFVVTVTSTTQFTYTMLTAPGANASVVGSYVTGYWGQVGGGAQAQGVVYENSQIIASNYTMTSGNSGESVGPITINSGTTVTIPSGSRWVIL